jgi:hypothetical protein
VTHRTTLESIRNREYAADGAVTLAISEVRTFTCATTTGVVQDMLNGIAIQVDWTTDCSGNVPSSDGTQYSQRNVDFAACVKPSTGVPCGAADVIIRAQVNYEPLAGPVTKTYIQAWSVNQ